LRLLFGCPAYLADLINSYGTRAAKLIGEEAVRFHPVVGIISPWNFPLILALGDAIPAMQAGAAVVVKPSEFAPLGLRGGESLDGEDRRPWSSIVPGSARPAERRSTRFTSPSSPARPAPSAR
jgi:hypothetical protein